MMIKHTQVKTQGRILGIVFMGGGVASVLIYLIVGTASSWSVGWRPFFLVSSIPGFIAAILTFKTARDVEEESVLVQVERKDTDCQTADRQKLGVASSRQQLPIGSSGVEPSPPSFQAISFKIEGFR